MENTSRADEIAEMALSYYAEDEILTNKTLTGKHIDVSIRHSTKHTPSGISLRDL
jgi:hypothetical protein